MRWIVILAAGCIEDPHRDGNEVVLATPRELPTTLYIDRIVQAAPPPVVDVLYIVDNTSSMEQEQRDLTKAFPAFMDFFLGSGLDYHIGVVSTDMLDPTQSGKLRGARGRLYIDDETPDANEVFAEMALMGTTGDVPKGREAAYVALEVRAEGSNAGFKRADASLHMIVVSDGSDHSKQISVGEFEAWARGEKLAEDTVNFSSITSDKPVCPTATDAGTDYMEITKALGGIFWSICDEDWDEGLRGLGWRASGLTREYFLSRLPVPVTIEVSVVEEGATYKLEPETGWVYIPERNSIVIDEFVPGLNAEVVVEYEVLKSLDET